MDSEEIETLRKRVAELEAVVEAAKKRRSELAIKAVSMRHKKLSAKRRSEIAKLANAARWAKKKAGSAPAKKTAAAPAKKTAAA